MCSTTFFTHFITVSKHLALLSEKKAIPSPDSWQLGQPHIFYHQILSLGSYFSSHVVPLQGSLTSFHLRTNKLYKLAYIWPLCTLLKQRTYLCFTLHYIFLACFVSQYSSYLTDAGSAVYSGWIQQGLPFHFIVWY